MEKFNRQNKATVQHSPPSSPSKGGKTGKTRPVMAINRNRVFLSSINDIRKSQDHRIKKSLELVEPDPPVIVEHAEDIKVKVEVETNNNMLTNADCIPLQDREEPSGAEDDDCEFLADDPPVENHEDIQVKVFTHSEQPISSVKSQDKCLQAPDVKTQNLCESTDSESSEVKEKCKKKKRGKFKSESSAISLSKKDSSNSPCEKFKMSEVSSRKSRRTHSRTSDLPTSPPRRSRTPISPSNKSSRRLSKSERPGALVRDKSGSPSRDCRRRSRSRSSKMSSRDQDSCSRDGRNHHRSAERREAFLRDRSESPIRDKKRRHQSRKHSKSPPKDSSLQKSRNHLSPEERKTDVNCLYDQDKYKDCDVANIPLPPVAKMSSSDSGPLESVSEDELEVCTPWTVHRTDVSLKNECNKSESKPSAPSHTHQASPAIHYYCPPSTYNTPTPHYYMHQQKFSTPPPFMSRGGVFNWSPASSFVSPAQSPTGSQQELTKLPYQSPSLPPAVVPISSPPVIEVDKKFKRLQNLHNPPRPNFRGYQLIGDSMLLRFSQQILGENAISAESLRFLGYCVSGQRIGDLLKRLKSGFYHLGKKVVVMIGTNDLLRSTPGQQMCNELQKIVDHLEQSLTEEIVILTLPPVPRLQNQTFHWQRLSVYNDFIKGLANKGRSQITPLDICKIFVDRRIPKCRLECFELTFSDNGRKDLIHLNIKGLTFVKDELYKVL